MYRQGFKTTASFGERLSSILTPVRQACQRNNHSQNARPFCNSTPTRLASREDELKFIAQHTRPNIVDRKLLVWTRFYKTASEIPESIPLTQIKRARELGRIVVGSAITLGFLVGIPVMMEWGRRSKSSGDSIAKRRKEWIHKLQRERRREREIEAAIASDSASDK